MNQKTAKQIGRKVFELTYSIMNQRKSKGLKWDVVYKYQKRKLKKMWYDTPRKKRQEMRKVFK